jgi:protein disulfide-isomerase
MIDSLFRRRILAAAALTVTAPVLFAQAPQVKSYDEAANPRQDIAAALAKAADANKKVLVVFGANWCGDCKMLDMEMHEGDLQKLVNDRLVVVKVDVGRFDRNKDVAEQYAPDILKKGIPSVALLNADGSVVYRTTGGELADARKMKREGVTAFFVSMLGTN